MEIKVLASGSSGNCYLVSDGSSSLLLDAGISLKKIRIGCDYQLSAVDGCLVTHSHGDHCKAVKSLLKAGISIYMPRLEIEHIGLPEHHRLHPLPISKNGSYECLKIGSFRVQPFRTEHDTPESVGYLLKDGNGENLLYFTDTYYLSYRFSNLHYIIGECNYDRETMWDAVNSGSTNTARARRLFTTHMSLDTFSDFLKANDTGSLKQIYVCHVSNDHGNEQRIMDTVCSIVPNAEVTIC